jgi:hypothetical protein
VINVKWLLIFWRNALYPSSRIGTWRVAASVDMGIFFYQSVWHNNFKDLFLHLCLCLSWIPLHISTNKTPTKCTCIYLPLMHQHVSVLLDHPQGALVTQYLDISMCLSTVQSLFICVQWGTCIVLVKSVKLLKWCDLSITVCTGRCTGRDCRCVKCK